VLVDECCHCQPLKRSRQSVTNEMCVLTIDVTVMFLCYFLRC